MRRGSHAHRKEIIHRDLKPENILISERDGEPEPKLIDFGLTKALQENALPQLAASKLSLNLIVGTPLYMPPERIQSPSQDADVRDDAYSLGSFCMNF